MFGNISHTWELMGQSWQVLMKEKGLLIFPLISGICCLLVCASFIIPSIVNETWMPPEVSADVEEGQGQPVNTQEQVLYYAKLFSFYFCNYLVIIFFNSAVVGCAALRMQGQDPTIGDGFRMAAVRFPSIIGWALISATVGLILRLIEDKNEKIGRFITALLGTAWTLMTFLVLPVLVIEGTGALSAVKRSTQLFKKTWGAQIGANFSFGFLFFLLFLPAILIVVLGFLSQNQVLIWIAIGIAVVYMIVLSLIQSCLQVIFQTALYFYADTGSAPQGFDSHLLRDAVAPK